MENYNYIIDVNSGERHSIFSETGRTLLKSYIQTYKSGGNWFKDGLKNIGSRFMREKKSKQIQTRVSPGSENFSNTGLDDYNDDDFYKDELKKIEGEMGNPMESKVEGEPVNMACKRFNEKDKNYFGCRKLGKGFSTLPEEGGFSFKCYPGSCALDTEGDYDNKMNLKKQFASLSRSSPLVRKHVRPGPPLRQSPRPRPPKGRPPVPNSVSGARNWKLFEYTTDEGKAIQEILIKIVDNKKDKKTVSVETQNEIFKNLEVLLGNPEGKAHEDIEFILRTQQLNPIFFNKLKYVVNKDDYPKSFAFFNDETPTSSAF